MNVEFKNGQLVLTWPGDDDSTVTLDTAEAVVVADWMEDRDNRAAIRRTAENFQQRMRLLTAQRIANDLAEAGADILSIAKDVGGKYAVHVSDAGDVPEPWEESPYTASSAERSHHTPEGVRVFARRVLHHAPNDAARRR